MPLDQGVIAKTEAPLFTAMKSLDHSVGLLEDTANTLVGRLALLVDANRAPASDTPRGDIGRHGTPPEVARSQITTEIGQLARRVRAANEKITGLIQSLDC